MKKKILILVKKDWGLSFLIILLLVISLLSLRPKLYLAGWDNFSVSLNSAVSFPRTLFATWREYRGFGVPSDSEAVDVFRQLLFLILDTALSKKLLEQVYLLLCFNTGVIGIYFLTKEVLKTGNFRFSSQLIKLGGLTGAFFYLFNLNALSVFFLPMTMYVSQFALFPLVLLFWFKIIKKEKISPKEIFFYSGSIMFFSAAYLTATIFLTLLIILGLVFLFNLKSFRRGIILGIFFLLLNAFWLLPFFNYVRMSSHFIPLASTYIEANEIQLNQASEYFGWKKLLIFWPTIFSTGAENLTTGQQEFIHPLAEELYKHPGLERGLWLLPFLAFIGTLIIIRKNKKCLYWLPGLFFLVLFLLRKECPPLGFVYDFFGKAIPHFKIIFRFSGEKLYPLLSISSCLLAAVALPVFYRFLVGAEKKIIRLITIPAFILLIYLFRFYFFGQFTSSLMHSRIPQEYFEIAHIINQDRQFGRALHLPEGEVSYWKSYSWGYVGSSFLGFMLNKPLLEKTFVPASLENDYWLGSLQKIAKNSQYLSTSESREERLTLLRELIKRAQVKYVIWDETVSQSVVLRNKIFWGIYSSGSYQALLKGLEKEGFLVKISEYSINEADYLALYPESRKLSESARLKIESESGKKIELYRVQADYRPVISANLALGIDPGLKNLFIRPLLNQDMTYIQGREEKDYQTYPFYQPESLLIENENNFQLVFPRIGRKSILAISESVDYENKTVAVRLEVEREEDNLVINLFGLNLPVIDQREQRLFLGRVVIPLNRLSDFDKPDANSIVLSNWHVLPEKSFSELRLAIGDLILPLPQINKGEVKDLGAVLVAKDNLVIEVLTLDSQIPLDLNSFALTENPNCYGDQVEGYANSVEKQGDLVLTTQNGTSCLIKPLNNEVGPETKYTELVIDYSYLSQDFETISNFKMPSILQKTVQKKIKGLETSNYFNLCLIDGFAGGCLNNHRSVRAESSGRILLPSDQKVEGRFLQLLLALPTIGYQYARLNLHSVLLRNYQLVFSQKIELTKAFSQRILAPNREDRLSVSFPKILSVYSYYYDSEVDAFPTYNQPCLAPASYRTTKQIGTATAFYNENCQNGIALNLKFNSDNFYLWQTNYHLFASKYPRYFLKGKLKDYQDEYLSVGQGYPNISEFKSFQRADSLNFLINRAAVNDYVENQLNEFETKSAFAFLYPQPGLGDSQEMVFTIEQNSKNQGLFTINGLNLIQLPEAWQNLVLESGEVQKRYSSLSILNSKRILPSLWQVKAIKPKKSEEKSLLVFNQAFADQWQAYQGSVFNALLGVNKLKADKVKVNGWANGWEIEKEAFEKGKAKTIYLFYTPERLAFIGWLITIFAFFIAPFILPKIWARLKN